jgi:lipocalin
VDYVDLDRYDGLWYEIARYPNLFQLGCVCTTARYGITGPDTVSVLNTCNRFWSRGPLTTIEGEAVVVDPITQAKLSVSFDTVPVPGDYWIIDLVEDPGDPTGDYAYAVVGEPSRRNLFILARDPLIDTPEEEAIYHELLIRLEAQFYDPSRLRVSRQPDRCVY